MWLPDMCDFEDGSCNWQQHTDDDWDWVRESGPSLSHDTGPNSDHTTNSPYGHYFSLQSSLTDFDGQTAKVSSPQYPAGETGPQLCPQLLKKRLSSTKYDNNPSYIQFCQCLPKSTLRFLNLLWWFVEVDLTFNCFAAAINYFNI